MKKKIYKVTVVSKLIDATHEELKKQIGEQQDESDEYFFAESGEDAIGQCMAKFLGGQKDLKIISISQNKLVFSNKCYVYDFGKDDQSVNTVEFIYDAQPIQ